MRKVHGLHQWGSRYLLTALIGVCCAAAHASFAGEDAPRYRVVLLGEPGTDLNNGARYMQPCRLNNRGDIIGGGSAGFFVLQGKKEYNLNRPSEEFISLMGINNRGVILGLRQDWSEEQPGDVWTYTLGPLEAKHGAGLENAHVLPFANFIGFDINDRGAIAGEMGSYQNGTRRAAVYENGQLRELPGLMPGGGDSFAAGINNRGQIVGAAQTGSSYRPVIWSSDRARNLGLVPGFSNAHGTAINDYGAAVGWCDNGDVCVGFMYRDGAVRLLPFPSQARYFMPIRMNDAGDVLFWFFSKREDEFARDWLYSKGRLHDMAPIVAEATGLPVVSVTLEDINDRGEIIGYAQYLEGEHWYAQGIVLVPEKGALRKEKPLSGQ